MKQSTNNLAVPMLLGTVAVATMLVGATAAQAQNWRNGHNNGGYHNHYGGGNYDSGRYHNSYGGGYYNHDHAWNHRRVWVEPQPSYVYTGPVYHYRHYRDYGHRRYYTYNGNPFYLDLDTGIRVEL